MASDQPPDEGEQTDAAPHFTDEVSRGDVQPWEQIELGRYMPRRTRGSHRGRALG
jgi:hypothetical protein